MEKCSLLSAKCVECCKRAKCLKSAKCPLPGTTPTCSLTAAVCSARKLSTPTLPLPSSTCPLYCSCRAARELTTWPTCAPGQSCCRREATWLPYWQWKVARCREEESEGQESRARSWARVEHCSWVLGEAGTREKVKRDFIQNLRTTFSGNSKSQNDQDLQISH